MASKYPSDGFVKVFVSSTYSDMKEDRKILLDRLNRSVCAIGMEGFIPNGESSQEIALTNEHTGLKNCDAAIFLITPWYGSLLEKCDISDCTSPCPMKKELSAHKKRQKISYTHCEYNYAMSKNIPYQTYLIENRWEILEKLSRLGPREREDLAELLRCEDFQGHSEEGLEHLIRVQKQALAWRKELDAGSFNSRINDEDIDAMADQIAGDLATNLILWHTKGGIEFREFCGRKSELKELTGQIQSGGTVEVWGVGGVGKTTLIQAALLIEILRGREVCTVGQQQAYMSGSGYRYFRENAHSTHYNIIGDTITLDDIGLALGIGHITEINQTKRKIETISDRLGAGNSILFIDDFQLADSGVRKLLENSALPIVISSKSQTGTVHSTFQIGGLVDDERDRLIDEIVLRHHMTVTEHARRRIKEIAEGHPVTTELLVRNSNAINFDTISNFKQDRSDRINDAQFCEFYKRTVEEILSRGAYKLLQNLAVLNTSVEGNISRAIVEKVYKGKARVYFKELIDTGMLEKKGEGRYCFTFKHLQEALQADKSGFHKAALKYYQEKLAGCTPSLEDRAEVLYHRLHAGEDIVRDYKELAAEVTPSIKAYRRLLEIGELSHGEKHRKMSADFNFTLGTLLQGYHRYPEAKEAYKKALELQRSEPAELKEIARIYNELGNVTRKMRSAKEAENYYLSILGSTIDSEIAQTEEYQSILSDVINNLAILYRTLGRYGEAEAAYQRALEVSKKLNEKYPGKHLPDIAQVYNNLGVLYRHLERYPDAERTLREALTIRRLLVISNPEKYRLFLANTLSTLGLLYIHCGRYEDAKPLLKETYEIKKKLADESPEAYVPSIAITITNLGLLYYREGRYYEAETELKKSLNLRRGLAHKNSQVYNPRLANTLNILGMVYRDTNRYDEAEESLREAYKIRSYLVDIDPDSFERGLANTLNNLGVLCVKQGKGNLAEPHFKKALEIQQNLVGKSVEAHTSYLLEILGNMIDLYRDLGREEEEGKYTKLLRLNEEALEKAKACVAYTSTTRPVTARPSRGSSGTASTTSRR